MLKPPENLVSVCIVTTGKKGYLWPLLTSIKAQAYPKLEIIIIDNSLDLNFNQEILKYCAEAKLYTSGRNLFFCEALNRGIASSKGDFILCLNDDVVLDKFFIEKAIRAFFIDKKIGLVSGKIMRSDGKVLDSTGLFLSPWRTAKERGYGFKDVGKFEKEEYIFGVNGAVAFYRKAMLEQIKVNSEYFDCDFHIFYEDIDIAWRSQNFGWKGYYIPDAIAYHVRGGTIRNDKGLGKGCARRFLDDRLNMDLVKNRYLAIVKNEKFLSFLLHLPLIVIYDFIVFSFVLFFRPSLFKKIIFMPIPLKSAFRKRQLLIKSKSASTW